MVRFEVEREMSSQVFDRIVRPRSYLVVEPEALIATDLAQTIVSFDPDARVICARSLAEAEASLLQIGSLEIALVAGCPSRFVGSALHCGIVERGGRVVLLGVEAEASGPTPAFDVLPQPFDTNAVVRRLRAGRFGNGPPARRTTHVLTLS